ncbi:MAG: hypothetical protein PF588_09685 [Candidatus Kapabacteria bacterium]|jgi:hypothetical protein|nr:hypothetical protein [Candidatus Kapabacteria bacterium]
MKNIMNFVYRNSLWPLISAVAALWLCPETGEVRTLLLIVLVESIALFLSGVALTVYTKLDFSKDVASGNLGLIFLGVHICAGLTALAVYIAQSGL